MKDYYGQLQEALYDAVGQGNKIDIQKEYCYLAKTQYLDKAELCREAGYADMERYKQVVIDSNIEELRRREDRLKNHMEYHHINLDELVSDEARRLAKFKELFNKIG